MDRLNDYARGYGFECTTGEADPVYTHGLTRFLDLFAKHRIRATIFVVGRDTLVPQHAQVLKRAVREGHELANHTLNHPRRLASLTDQQLSNEIDEAHRLISQISGETVCGFRAPCYDISSRTIDLLRQHGYLYDSSIHPTFFGILIDMIVLLKSGFRRWEARPGTYLHLLSSLRPYYPARSACWRAARRDTGALIELPLSAMPWSRLPFYGTFTQMAGMNVFGVFLAWLKLHRCPLNFHFHGIELIDLNDEGVDPRLAIHPGLKKPPSQKIDEVGQILGRFNEAYEMMPLKQMAQRYLNQTH